MKTIKPLIPYNLCQMISILYSLFILELNQLNPSKHLPKVISISFGFQIIGLLICHSMASNKTSFQNFSLFETTVNLTKSIVFYYGLVVLLGAPLLTEKLNTLYLSVLLTIMTTLPVLVVCKPNNLVSNLMNCFNRLKIEPKMDNIVMKTSLITLIGGWLGAFPIVLDWMQPWQEWPITICLGAMFANLLSNVFSLAFIVYKNIKKSK